MLEQRRELNVSAAQLALNSSRTNRTTDEKIERFSTRRGKFAIRKFARKIWVGKVKRSGEESRLPRNELISSTGSFAGRER